jgi:uncharacterized protein (TIGR02001 family)
MKTTLKAAMLGTALSVTALCGGTAFADDAAAPAPAVSFSGNIAISTDYMFRGITQSNSEPAVSGGFDASSGQFYVGTWASSISFAPMEWDVYGGFKPVTGPISWDIGAIGYIYPSAHDDAASFTYMEGYVKPSFAPTPNTTLGLAAYISPDFALETGTAYYIEGNASWAVTKSLSVSGAVGYQDISNVDGKAVPGDLDGNYTTWNIGATYSLAGFAFDLRYVDTDISATDPITAFSGATQNTKGRAVFTIKRAM